VNISSYLNTSQDAATYDYVVPLLHSCAVVLLSVR